MRPNIFRRSVVDLDRGERPGEEERGHEHEEPSGDRAVFDVELFSVFVV